jgi:hypothetical protein
MDPPEPAVYEVVDANGRWLGTVRMPKDSGRVLSVGLESILTEWVDTAGVPYVRAYQIIRPN